MSGLREALGMVFDAETGGEWGPKIDHRDWVDTDILFMHVGLDSFTYVCKVVCTACVWVCACLVTVTCCKTK